MQIERHTVINCGTRIDSNGRWLDVSELVRILKYLSDDENPEVMLSKINELIEEIKK